MTRVFPRSARGLITPVGRLLFFVLLVAIWQIATLYVSPLTLPAPWAVAKKFGPLITSATFRSDLLVTVEQILAAIAIATAIGLSLGILGWRFLSFRIAVFPWLSIANAVPTILLYPVAIVVLGLGSKSIVVLSVFLGSMAIAENTYAGLRSVNEVYLDVADCLQASALQRFRKVLFPGAIEAIATGFRIGFTAVFVLVVATGYILSGSGLGYRLRYFYEAFQMENLYALVLVIVVLALACQAILTLALAWLRRGSSVRIEDLAAAPAFQGVQV